MKLRAAGPLAGRFDCGCRAGDNGQSFCFTMDTIPTFAILGPTASGKTDLAVSLARHFGAEIISCDSMQVYRELRLGTAKPTPRQLNLVRHHLINCASIHERFDVNRFVTEARKILADCAARGKKAILAGGTGLYAKALVYGFQLQPADGALFRAVCDQASDPAGVQALRDELEQSYRLAGEAIPGAFLANPRRLIRAVEILRLTGKPPAASPPAETPATPRCPQFVIMPHPGQLKERIFRRTEAMLQAGWIDEALELGGNGLLDTPTAYQALGYREIVEWSKSSGRPTGWLADRIATKTWQYARRQMTWFRHQHPRACLLTVGETTTTDEMCAAIIALAAAG